MAENQATLYQRLIGGLLGEDLSKLDEEERRRVAGQATSRAVQGLLMGEGLLGGLGGYRRERQEDVLRRQKQVERNLQESQAQQIMRQGGMMTQAVLEGRRPLTAAETMPDASGLQLMRGPMDLSRLAGTEAGQQALLANPQLREAVLKMAPQPSEAPTPTDDMREYQVAVAQGYRGGFMDYLRDIKGASAPRITVPGQTLETEYERAAGKTRFESQDAAYKAAQAAVDSLDKIYSTLDLINTGQPFTGALADTELSIARIAAKVAGREDKRISDTEVLDALLGSEVFAQLSALGVGARGLDTPAEREFLREVITGTKSLNAETLKRMTEIRANVTNKIIDRYNQRVDRGELDNYFRSMGIPKAKIQKPAKPERVQSVEGQRAVDDATGKTYVFRNGRWIDERSGAPYQPR